MKNIFRTLPILFVALASAATVRAQEMAAPAAGPLRGASAALPALALRAATDTVISSERLTVDPAPSQGRPALSAPLALGLGFVGAGAGLVFGYKALGCSDDGAFCSRGGSDAEYTTLAVGMAVGAAAGAHLGGMRRDSRGRLLHTLVAAGVGAIPVLFAHPEDDAQTQSVFVMGWVGSAALATIADNLSRERR